MLTVRPATGADHAAIWAILEPVFRAGETYTIDKGIARDAALAYWMAHQCFIAETGGDILGTYYLRPNQQGGGAHVCNCGYATARAARGRGVASAMCAHSLQTARDAGFRAMQFNFVVVTNTGAIRLWQRHGFDTVGRLPRAFDHPTEGEVDALVMHRFL